jgi:ABC-2 type transport system permease protein
MRFANTWHLGVKELWSLMRNPIMLIFVVYSFTVSVYQSATATPETLNRAAIGIVDEDRSQLSKRIIDAFYPPHFLPPVLIGLDEMNARMDTGLDTFALVIPAGFQRDVLGRSRAELQLNIDATRMGQAFTGGGYVQSIVSSEIEAFLRGYRSVSTPQVDLVLRARFNPTLNKSWFGGVIQVVNQVTMISILLTGAALIREREHGTIEHLLVMPVTPFELMTSKVWAMGFVVLTASAFSLVFIVQILLTIPIEGSTLLFLAGAALHLFATTSMGIFLATIARSMPQFAMLFMLVLMPMQMLSGGTTPRESMPEFIQVIMLGAPTTHFIILAQAILFRGAGLSVVWPQFIALVLLGAAFFSYSLGRFRKTIGSMA